LLECVVNIAEGRRLDVLDELSRSGGASLRDRHHDEDHHRSVFTLINTRDLLVADVRGLITRATELIDLRLHTGVHPRLGVVDVVPFVALTPPEKSDAHDLRDDTAAWMAQSFDLPTFLYGRLANDTTRSLPEVRRGAFRTLEPDFGPPTPNEQLGASAVGERGVLVAWNLWLREVVLDDAKAIASAIRRPEVRALALPIDDFVQISCNLIAPFDVTPSAVYDDVRTRLPSGEIHHCEVVGLVPAALLEREDPSRWEQLDLDPSRTIEARIS
jgi:glutamate formiminotransferase